MTDRRISRLASLGISILKAGGMDIGTRAVRLLHAAQVEFHGQYSVERLRLLHDSTTSAASTLHVVAALVATPLPCLAVILLLDTIPLDPPSAGTNGNVGFWVRASVSNAACSLCLITLYASAIPTLRLSRSQVLVVVTVVVTVVAAGTQRAGYALALGIGFPVPFIATLQGPVYVSLLVDSLSGVSASHIRATPCARTALRDWIMVVITMNSMLTVYPLCNYAFEKASAHGQMGISLLMGAVKIAYKNAISRSIREQADRRPEIVSFQAEVSHALFVTFSMQNASSMSTIAVLLSVDLIHGCATLYEVHLMAQKIAELEQRCLDAGVPLAPPRATSFSSRASRAVVDYWKHNCHVVSTRELGLLTVAVDPHAPT